MYKYSTKNITDRKELEKPLCVWQCLCKFGADIRKEWIRIFLEHLLCRQPFLWLMFERFVCDFMQSWREFLPVPCIWKGAKRSVICGDLKLLTNRKLLGPEGMALSRAVFRTESAVVPFQRKGPTHWPIRKGKCQNCKCPIECRNWKLQIME